MTAAAHVRTKLHASTTIDGTCCWSSGCAIPSWYLALLSLAGCGAWRRTALFSRRLVLDINGRFSEAPKKAFTDDYGACLLLVRS